MYERISTLALLYALTMTSPACAAGNPSVQAESAQTPRAARTQSFTPVEGADLKSKLDEAVRRGRAGSKSAPFWVAYTFDVRPG
ncbi:MAG TPA: hypothetical protein VGV38_06045, partial [Pyrinomonadaceae bacterium]|nr:hypothetical protein [Pyrinomonadaceae bacterium]